MNTAEDNIEVVRAIYEAFAVRDVEGVVTHLAPDSEFRPAGTALIAARDAPYRGPDGMREYFEDVAFNWDELVLEPTDFRAAGASVVVFGHVRGRAPAAEVDTDVTWVWKLRDGLVIDCRVFPTSGEALRWLDADAAV